VTVPDAAPEAPAYPPAALLRDARPAARIDVRLDQPALRTGAAPQIQPDDVGQSRRGLPEDDELRRRDEEWEREGVVPIARPGHAVAPLVIDDFAIEPGAWQGIVSIFAHVDGALRARVHARVERGLAPGGVFLLEAYRPEQIGRGTGGPPDDDRMVNLERLRRELRSLEFVVAREVDRDVLEGTRHRGMSSVVQLVARRRG